MIYLDYAATTPISDTAIDAYRECAEKYYGNPSSHHDIGSESSRVLESARKIISGRLNVPQEALYFSGSGSEANYLSILSLALSNQNKGKHLITTPIEHSCVRNAFNWLEKRGFEVTRIPVDQHGRVRLDILKNSIRDDTILASIQFVNSETGVIQNLEQVGQILKEKEVIFHSDFVQGFCKLPVDVKGWGLHSVSISGHKVHGPKGIGATYVDRSLTLKPFMPGTVHESGFRPGTVDVPAATAFAVASKELVAQQSEYLEKVANLRQGFINLISKEIADSIVVEENPESNSPYILGIRLKEMEGQHTMLECNRLGLAISTGSACRINEQNPSAIMVATGKPEQEARQFVRLSFSHQNNHDQIRSAAEIFTRVIKKHKAAITH